MRGLLEVPHLVIAPLNSPLGVALAPNGFGAFGGDQHPRRSAARKPYLLLAVANKKRLPAIQERAPAGVPVSRLQTLLAWQCPGVTAIATRMLSIQLFSTEGAPPIVVNYTGMNWEVPGFPEIHPLEPNSARTTARPSAQR